MRASPEVSARKPTGSGHKLAERRCREALRADHGKFWQRSRCDHQRRLRDEDFSGSFRKEADGLTMPADGAARSGGWGKKRGTCRARPPERKIDVTLRAGGCGGGGGYG